jgi:hypothetical protein
MLKTLTAAAPTALRSALVAGALTLGAALAAPAAAQAQSFRLEISSGHSSHWGAGPTGHWTRWNDAWGAPHVWAGRWGFDEYCPRRGWRTGSTWHRHPSGWSRWPGHATHVGGGHWRGDRHPHWHGHRDWRDDRGRRHGVDHRRDWDDDDDDDDRRRRWSDRDWRDDRRGWSGGCRRLEGRDWVRGRPVIVTYAACVDHRGRWIEQPGSRRIVAWL